MRVLTVGPVGREHGWNDLDLTRLAVDHVASEEMSPELEESEMDDDEIIDIT